jgi:hypothetical protein
MAILCEALPLGSANGITLMIEPQQTADLYQDDEGRQ